MTPECGFGDASGEASGEPGAWIGNGGATSFGDGGTLCRTWSWRLTVPGTMGGGEVEVASRATSSAADFEEPERATLRRTRDVCSGGATSVRLEPTTTPKNCDIDLVACAPAATLDVPSDDDDDDDDDVLTVTSRCEDCEL